MTAMSRVIAVALGMAGLLVAMAALVREVVLAADPSVVWRRAGWWTRLTTEPTWATAVTAAATAAVAILLFILAFRQFGGSRRRAMHVEFGTAEGRARLDLRALETALARQAKAELPEVGAPRVTLRMENGGLFARLETRLPARDLLGVQAQAMRVFEAGLARLGGIRLDGVDIVVTGVTNVRARTTAPSDG